MSRPTWVRVCARVCAAQRVGACACLNARARREQRGFARGAAPGAEWQPRGPARIVAFARRPCVCVCVCARVHERMCVCARAHVNVCVVWMLVWCECLCEWRSEGKRARAKPIQYTL